MKLTPRNRFPYPEEREEPFYGNFVAGLIAEDHAHWANADNGNLTYYSSAVVSWDAGTNTLDWDDVVFITGFADSYPAFLPAGSINIQDGEVVFFKMPRYLKAPTELTLYRSNRIFLEGVRLHDLRLFVARIGTTLYFSDGLSMLTGQSGPLFGGGLGGGGGGGTITLIQSPLGTISVSNPAGPTVSLETSFSGSGGALGVAASSARSDHAHAGTAHNHQPPLIFTPGAGSSGPFNMAFTSPTLLRVDFFRNGQLQREGAGNDYTLALGTGLVTLLFVTLAPDVLTFWRETL